jgi:hypothetical protein
MFSGRRGQDRLPGMLCETQNSRQPCQREKKVRKIAMPPAQTPAFEPRAQLRQERQN